MSKIIVGNWKMYPESLGEAISLFKKVGMANRDAKGTTIVVCPPVLYIQKLFSLKSKLLLGAQDVHLVNSGPYTGEVSSPMLESVGVKYVIVGHSERRDMGESDQLINKKIKNALENGLWTIFCIGEKNRDEGAAYFQLVREQIKLGLMNVPKKLFGKVIVAYEPVWAIGKDVPRAAYPNDVLEMSIFIKKTLSEMAGREIGMSTPILYGGSVDEKNCLDFLSKGGVDGLLIGRASLNPDIFNSIVKTAKNV